MLTLIDSVMLTVLGPSVSNVLEPPGRSADMFNDKMLLPPVLILGVSVLDEMKGACVKLGGGWVVRDPSSLGFDEIAGKSVVGELVGRSRDKVGGVVVGEPIGRSRDKELIGRSMDKELIGRSMDKNGDSVVDELGSGRKADTTGTKFSSAVAVVDGLTSLFVDDGRTSVSEEGYSSEIDDRGSSVLVARGASVLGLGGGSTIDERSETMDAKMLLSSIALLVVVVSTEVEGTGVGVGVLDTCGSPDDTCWDVVDSPKSGMSKLTSASDTELLEGGGMTARSDALGVDDALEALGAEGSATVVEVTVEVSVEGSVEGTAGGTAEGLVDGTVAGTGDGFVGGTVDVCVDGPGVASVGEVVESEAVNIERTSSSMLLTSRLELELESVVELESVLELESMLELVTVLELVEPESPLELENAPEPELESELELELELRLEVVLELEPESALVLGLELGLVVGSLILELGLVVGSLVLELGLVVGSLVLELGLVVGSPLLEGSVVGSPDVRSPTWSSGWFDCEPDILPGEWCGQNRNQASVSESWNKSLATRNAAASGLAGFGYVNLMGEGYAVRESVRRAPTKAANESRLPSAKPVAASQNCGSVTGREV